MAGATEGQRDALSLLVNLCGGKAFLAARAWEELELLKRRGVWPTKHIMPDRRNTSSVARQSFGHREGAKRLLVARGVEDRHLPRLRVKPDELMIF